MNITESINQYINELEDSKQKDLQMLHNRIIQAFPNKKLWFLDGKNEENKVVSNPNIGYGSYNLKYANGKQKEFYQVGLSANSSGLSVYFMGLEDKKTLENRFVNSIGKAKITGYCIKFKSLAHINTDTLFEAIELGLNR